MIFTNFPQRTDRGYQGGENLPDPTTGWAHLHQSGGHPGHGPNYHAILRFTAPESGRYRLDTKVALAAQMSDGIVVTAVRNADTVLTSIEIAAQSEGLLELGDIQLEKGATLDLVVACGRTESHDSFSWNPNIRTADQHWSYSESFSQTQMKPSRWQQYAHALLSTNEFAFVD